VDAGKVIQCGTSSNPWQTLAKVSASYSSGSTIYLKEHLVRATDDPVFPGSRSIPLEPEPLPRIDGSKEITRWTDEGGGLYSSPAVTLA
jgi:hypothetical protein